MEKQSTYLYQDISAFFTPSEIIDYHIGKHYSHSLQTILSSFQQSQYTLPSLLSLFSYILDNRQQADITRLVVKQKQMRELINNDGVKLLLCGINAVLAKLQEKQGGSLQNQMSLKVLFNIIYISIDYLQTNSNHTNSSQELNQLIQDLQLDDTLMKIVTLSLEYHFIPIKKLTMLYTKIITNIFHHKQTHSLSSIVHPHNIYSDVQANKLPHNNLLKYGQLQKYKTTNPPPNNASQINKNKVSSIELFYRKHNTGQCPLAQSIVVGLLRSLLTICNCQTHKKFQTVKGQGVDSFRQWQISYRYLMQQPQLHSLLPTSIIQRLRAYELFDLQSCQKGNEGIGGLQLQIFSQFYTHKIYTTSAITTFFILMLVALRQNMFIQYSYFLQLISDANGILVFLKFLTDKFSGLDYVTENIVFSKYHNQIDSSFKFKQKTMLTIYSVLLMLFTSCNNYPEKIRNYLFEYNSYLIIKKIPTLFLGKNIGKSKIIQNGNEENQLQNSQTGCLPSKEEIDEFAQQGKSKCGPAIIRKLTELCYDLLKIQIPFFSKKMKQNTNNMKMIIDIYCKYPKKTQPRILTPLQKLLLKSKSGLIKNDKFITSVQQMKTIHNQYNNIYYWSNDFLQNTSISATNRNMKQNVENMIDPELWLQQNLWKYYD